MISLLAMMLCSLQVNEHLTIYPLVSPEAGLGWKLELFELAEPIPAHYHKIQRQIVLVAEGELIALYGSEEPILLRCGEFVCVDPGVVHSLIPKGTVRFFTIDLPGFVFPEDVYYDTPAATPQWTFPDMEFQPLPDSKNFGSRIDQEDYAVYELITGNLTEGKWCVALIEIQNVPKHFHRNGKEIFIVVNGELDIEIEGVHQILAEGESAIVHSRNVHQLKSTRNEPVRVLCFNFPAFDPEDMFYVNKF